MKNSNFKTEIATQLLMLLENNASIEQLSCWAENCYSLYCRGLDRETEEIINRIAFMSNGPEFHLERNELEKFAKKWLADGAKWRFPKEKPENWSLEEQMKNIPEEFR